MGAAVGDPECWSLAFTVVIYEKRSGGAGSGGNALSGKPFGTDSKGFKPLLAFDPAASLWGLFLEEMTRNTHRRVAAGVGYNQYIVMW